MATQTSTLNKIHILEALYHHGYQSDIIDRALDKIITLERDRARHELTDLQSRLRAFEARYQMSSETFYRRFHAGELGDGADFFEWSAFYNMYQTIRERINSFNIEPV